jgi:hypothetical protein
MKCTSITSDQSDNFQYRFENEDNSKSIVINTKGKRPIELGDEPEVTGPFNIQEIEHAVQKPSPAGQTVRDQPEGGQGVRRGDPQGDEASRESATLRDGRSIPSRQGEPEAPPFGTLNLDSPLPVKASHDVHALQVETRGAKAQAPDAPVDAKFIDEERPTGKSLASVKVTRPAVSRRK